MTILRSIEQLAEELVEGSVRRALRPKLQPVELALRMGHSDVADLLKTARQEAEAQALETDEQPAALAG